MLLQLLAVGTIAHQGQPCIGKGLQHRADPFDLLLRGEAADVEQQRTTVVMAAEKPLAQLRAAQLGTEQLRVHTPLPQISVLNAFVAELLHHGGGGAQIQQGLVVGGLEHLPQEWLQHSQAVVLEVLGQVGVITRHQRDAFVLREPDAAETQHRRVHNVDQIGLKRIDRVGHCRARQGQFELGIERQRHRRNADQACPHVLIRTAFRAEDHHFIAGVHQMLHRLGQTGDDAIDLRQEGFGEEGDFQG